MARYTAAANALGNTVQGSETGNTTKQSTGNINETTTSQGTSTQVGSSSSRETSNVDYLDPVARQALNALISSLSKGGTPAQKQQMEARLNEIVTNQNIRGNYSQANAFAQAEGAANSALAKSLQATLPQIAASVDAAGTSGSSFSGLLTQQAAADAASMAAELGLQASVQYGQIQAGLGGVLEQLTRSEVDPAINSLLEALNIAKGASESGVRTTSGSSTSTTTSSEVGTRQATEDRTETGALVGTTSTTTTPNKAKANTANNNTYSGLNTPSSNRSQLTQTAAYKPGKTSYSQFGG